MFWSLTGSKKCFIATNTASSQNIISGSPNTEKVTRKSEDNEEDDDDDDLSCSLNSCDMYMWNKIKQASRIFSSFVFTKPKE